jgi:hypothetical protein
MIASDASRQIMNFASAHGYVFGEGCLIYESPKALGEFVISASTITILEGLSNKHPQFYERLLSTIDIRVQKFITSCVDANVDAIKVTLLDFKVLKIQLRLQNTSSLAGPVFLDTNAGVPTGATKRASHDAEGGAEQQAKAKSVTYRNPHPSLSRDTFAKWDKVRKFTDSVPKVGGVFACARFHCRQSCNSGCEHIHGRLSPSAVGEMEAWLVEARAKA